MSKEICQKCGNEAVFFDDTCFDYEHFKVINTKKATTEIWCDKCLIKHNPLIVTWKIFFKKQFPFIYVKRIFRFLDTLCDRCKKNHKKRLSKDIENNT